MRADSTSYSKYKKTPSPRGMEAITATAEFLYQTALLKPEKPVCRLISGRIFRQPLSCGYYSISPAALANSLFFHGSAAPFLWDEGFFVKPLDSFGKIRYNNPSKLPVWRNGRRKRLKIVRETMWVRVPPPAPNQYNPNLFPIGDGFGLFVFFDRYETTYFRNGVKRKPTSKPRGPRKKRAAI